MKVSHEPNRSIAEFLNELPCATLTSSIDLPINTKPSVLFPKSSFVRNNLLKEGVAIIFTDSLHVHRPLNLFLMDLQLNLLFRGLIFNELWCSHWISKNASFLSKRKGFQTVSENLDLATAACSQHVARCSIFAPSAAHFQVLPEAAWRAVCSAGLTFIVYIPHVLLYFEEQNTCPSVEDFPSGQSS